MTLHIGCMIRPLGWADRLKARAPEAWLNRAGFQVVQATEAPLAPGDTIADHQIAIHATKTMEIWVGGGLFSIFNALCATSDLSGYGTCLVMIADETGGFYGLQEVYKGHAGWGGQVIVDPPRTWTRAFDPSRDKQTPDAHRKSTFQALAKNIGATADLVERCVTGMNGKGRYGIAWHGDRAEWVLARIGSAGAGQLQELEPDTYGRKGMPFDPSLHPEGWPSYWKQEHLFMAAQDHLARAWGGIAISQLSHDHPALAGDVTKFSITPI